MWSKFAIRTNIVISILNLVVLVCFWYRYSSPVLASTVGFASSDFIAAQANHNAILQVHLVIFSIFLAILGFFGYNEIKKSAERTAAEQVQQAINELVPKLVKEQIEKLGPKRIEQMLVGSKVISPEKKDEYLPSDEVRAEEVMSGLEEK